MSMPRTIAVGFFCLVWFNPLLDAASLIINEIMYNPKGADTYAEWVEIVNISTTSVDISSYRFFDGENHKLKCVRGDSVISSGEYAILASSATRFIEYNPSCLANVFDTVMALKNTNCYVALIDNFGVVLDSVCYDSAWNNNTEGFSIERSSFFDSMSWHSSSVEGGTPGKENSAQDGSDDIQTTTASIYPVITEVAANEINDFIELYFTAQGAFGGCGIYQGETCLKELQPAGVSEGQIVVLYFNSQNQDETADSNQNGFLELYSAKSGLTATDNVISVRNPEGNIVYDALSYSNNDRSSFMYKESYNLAAEHNAWSPAVLSAEVEEYEKNSVDSSKLSSGKSITRKISSAGVPLINAPGNKSYWYIGPAATPGFVSANQENTSGESLNIIGPNPFSPWDNNSSRRCITIAYNAPSGSTKNLFIFDVNGRLRIKLIDNNITFRGDSLDFQDSGIVVWDGYNSDGEICPLGIYIIYFEASYAGTKVSGKKTCVLAKPL